MQFKATVRLFSYGYVKQACKIAGMKRPRAWTSAKKTTKKAGWRRQFLLQRKM